jgi:hypothetical protein
MAAEQTAYALGLHANRRGRGLTEEAVVAAAAAAAARIARRAAEQLVA